MPRSINEIQNVFPAPRLIFHLDGMALNRDATLALQIHIVEHLPLSNLDGVRLLQETVGKSRLAMIDMCDDAKVSDIVHALGFVYCKVTYFSPKIRK